ncbi:hypothetical protein OIO90_002830 [Microbotryomycetes sp. JL221]|nr:hypothetical protein OIO90_002830 [Microbotryomycetes sp. JL221]
MGITSAERRRANDEVGPSRRYHRKPQVIVKKGQQDAPSLETSTEIERLKRIYIGKLQKRHDEIVEDIIKARETIRPEISSAAIKQAKRALEDAKHRLGIAARLHLSDTHK